MAAIIPYLQLAYKKCGLQTYFLNVVWGFILTSPDVVLLFQAWYHFLFQHYRPKFYQCQGQSFPDLTLLASQCTEKIIYDACF